MNEPEFKSAVDYVNEAEREAIQKGFPLTAERLPYMCAVLARWVSDRDFELDNLKRDIRVLKGRQENSDSL